MKELRRNARPCSPLLWLAIGIGSLGSSCSRSNPVDQSGTTPEPLVVPELSDVTLGARWQQLASPSPTTDSEVFRTPLGWFSLSARPFSSDGKANFAFESYLYRSLDGVNWHLVSLPNDPAAAAPATNNLLLGDMTYATGKLVVVGRLGGINLLASADGEHFEAFSIHGKRTDGFHNVVYAGDRFFALGDTDAFTSLNGSRWERSEFGDPFLPNAAAYGNSLFLIAGNDGLALSSNATDWQRSVIDCGVPGGCAPDPGGNLHHIMLSAWFSEGRFYSRSIDGHWLRSREGVTWEEAPPGPIPFARWGEYEVGADSTGIAVWKPGAAPVYLDLHTFPLDDRGTPRNPGATAEAQSVLDGPRPAETARFPLDSGQDCTTSPCIVVDGALYIAE